MILTHCSHDFNELEFLRRHLRCACAAASPAEGGIAARLCNSTCHGPFLVRGVSVRRKVTCGLSPAEGGIAARLCKAHATGLSSSRACRSGGRSLAGLSPAEGGIAARLCKSTCHGPFLESGVCRSGGRSLPQKKAKIQARAELALGPRRPCLRAGARRYPACREPQTLLVGLLVDP